MDKDGIDLLLALANEPVDQFKQVIELNPGYVDIGKAKKQLRKIEKGR